MEDCVGQRGVGVCLKNSVSRWKVGGLGTRQTLWALILAIPLNGRQALVHTFLPKAFRL